MKVTEDDGAKRATCSACGHSVLLPPADAGTRTSRGDQPPAGKTAWQAGQTSVARSPRRAPPPTDLSPEPIHDLPTRVAGYEEPGASLTALLAPPQQPDEIGRLGPYRVLEVIGAGGMGVVYKAHDPHLDRLVALKAILPAFASNVTARERFQREARTAARLQHDRIVSVYQVGEDRGVPFLAMPLLRASRSNATLPAAARSGRRDRADRGGNRRGAGCHPRTWAGASRHQAGEPLSGGGGAAGEDPRFWAGPRRLGRRPADGRWHHRRLAGVHGPRTGRPQAGRRPADLFSLGGVLYYLATGVPAFQGAEVLAVLLAVASSQPPPPCECRPGLPRPLWTWSCTCSPRNRPTGRPRQLSSSISWGRSAAHSDTRPAGHSQAANGVSLPGASTPSRRCDGRCRHPRSRIASLRTPLFSACPATVGEPGSGTASITSNAAVAG
ncbi:MAG: serine/threonine-protein kinase [Gemmataceae bacterium]